MDTKISLLSDKPVRSPVLLLTYNRPAHTARVWAALREARPLRLWLSQDGPKTESAPDREKCSLVREIISAVDWPCEVRQFYREENAGCGTVVSSAIEWFLDEAGEGIILEDDVLPTPTFFRFCEKALESYRNEKDIASISGFTCLPMRIQGALSLSDDGEPILNAYLSKYFSMWGWATWRDRWEGYALNPDGDLLAKFHNLIPGISKNSLQEISHRNVLSSLQSVDTWDFQFEFHSWLHGRRHLVPTSNLTRNIGFDEEATHTKHESIFSNTDVICHDCVALPPSPFHEPDLDDFCHYLRIQDSRIVDTLLEENDLLRKTCEERLELIEFLHHEAGRLRELNDKLDIPLPSDKPATPLPSAFVNRVRRLLRF